MKKYIAVNDTVKVTLPYSEVCMHMKVAGKEMNVTLLSPWQAQLHDEEGNPFSFPIAPGEAGIMWDHTGFFVPKG